MRWLKRGLPAVALACVLTTPAAAQITGRPLEFSGGAGLFAYDTRARVQDGLAFTGSVGLRTVSWFALEVVGVTGPSKSDNPGNPDQSFLYGGLDLRFNVRPAESRVVPYVIAGFGYGRSKLTGGEPTTLARGAPSLAAGALFNLFGRSRMFARLQVRDVMFKGRDSHEFGNDAAVTAALHYVLGGKYKDTDLDDVREWIDECAETPIGATVDAKGCPHDGDGDAVLDGLDKCPDTPKGCKVDRNGCSLDADGDGICDGLDTCAVTPKGCKVDALGCPLDADGDGVCDGVDQCADTPKGCKVDASGCPLDADGDGVCDGVDQCANTVPGAQVDDRGCETPASVQEGELLDTGSIRLQNVNFATGKADLTPESMPGLDAAGEVLTRWPELKVEVGGHTDAQGKPEANLRLSKARADSVRAYLLRKFPAIVPGQLVAKGYGSSRPVAAEETEAGGALNRRVEIVVLNTAELVKAGGKRRIGPAK